MAADILYFPGIIDKFEELFPDLGSELHLETELEDVAELIPGKLEQSNILISIRSALPGGGSKKYEEGVCPVGYAVVVEPRVFAYC